MKTFLKIALLLLTTLLLGPIVVVPLVVSTLKSMRTAHARFLVNTSVVDLDRIGHLAPMLAAAAEKALAEQALGHLKVVFCEDRTMGVNASVVRHDDSAFIGLSFSAVKLVETDPEEFAALLAHEVAHVALDHARKRSASVTATLVLLALASPVASYFYWGSTTALVGAALVFVVALCALNYVVAWRDRRFELEADARARDLGHAQGLRRVLSRPEPEGGTPTPPTSKSLDSHPSTELRLARLS